ncbi:Imm7 family immunity protein [Streptomyces sp. NPDC002181]|uniref:Imm7 family immunity protein n=1 Tax=Streptomyces sp. NPDC002181 TaxID=3364635 RepID=UPI00367C48F2
MGWPAPSRRRSAPDVVGLFEHVAKAAPGSYGLLHVRDDEDTAHEGVDRACTHGSADRRSTSEDEWVVPECLSTHYAYV